MHREESAYSEMKRITRAFFEDTMKAGHYENRKESVDLMIRKSREIIDDLIGFGVDFEQEDGCLKYTREGGTFVSTYFISQGYYRKRNYK